MFPVVRSPSMAGKPFVPVEHRLALTVPEAAALCGIPEKVVRAAVVHGDLRHFEKGSTTARIRRTDLEDWVALL